jgi:hypothetical protein
MQKICDNLKNSPKTMVEVLDSPDDICIACPNLSGEKCVGRGEDAESRIRNKDLAVLETLSLKPGSLIPAEEVFARTAAEFAGRIENLCANCDWLSLGWCAEGLANRAMSKRLGDRGPCDTAGHDFTSEGAQ